MALSLDNRKKYNFFTVSVFYKILWSKMNVLWVIIYCFKLILPNQTTGMDKESKTFMSFKKLIPAFNYDLHCTLETLS